MPTTPAAAPNSPASAPTSPLALTLALAGIGGWDVRVGRLDAECEDLHDWLAAARVTVPPEAIQ